MSRFTSLPTSAYCNRFFFLSDLSNAGNSSLSSSLHSDHKPGQKPCNVSVSEPDRKERHVHDSDFKENERNYSSKRLIRYTLFRLHEIHVLIILLVIFLLSEGLNWKGKSCKLEFSQQVHRVTSSALSGNSPWRPADVSDTNMGQKVIFICRFIYRSIVLLDRN